MSEKAFEIICEIAGEEWPNSRGRHYPYGETEDLMDAYLSIGREDEARRVAEEDITTRRNRIRTGYSGTSPKHDKNECDVVRLYARVAELEAILGISHESQSGPLKIYVICPVRNVTDEQLQEIADYVASLEAEGHEVHFPPRDVDQTDPTGFNIVSPHADAMIEAAKSGNGRVDIFWDVNSSGSHFDLGMWFILFKLMGLPVNLVKFYQPDNEGKSFVKVMKVCEALSNTDQCPAYEPQVGIAPTGECVTCVREDDECK